MDHLRKFVEEKITEAIENGEFDNLALKGQPIDLHEDQHIPVEMRMAYRILKRAGVPPEEVSMAQGVSVLRMKIANDPNLSDEEKTLLRKKIALMDLELTMKLERFRKQFGGV